MKRPQLIILRLTLRLIFSTSLLVLAGCSFSKDSNSAQSNPETQNKNQVSTVDPDLFRAISEGNLDLFQKTLAKTSDQDINAYDKSGRTALELAVRYENVKIVELLLQRGALPLKPHYQTEETALSLAERVSPSIFKILSAKIAEDTRQIQDMMKQQQFQNAFLEMKRRYLTTQSGLAKELMMEISDLDFQDLHQLLLDEEKIILAAPAAFAIRVAKLGNAEVISKYFQWSKSHQVKVPEDYFQNIQHAAIFDHSLQQSIENKLEVSTNSIILNLKKFSAQQTNESILSILEKSEKLGIKLDSENESHQGAMSEVFQNFFAKAILQAGKSQSLNQFLKFFERQKMQLKISHEKAQLDYVQKLYSSEMSTQSFAISEIESHLSQLRQIVKAPQFCESCLTTVLSAKEHISQKLEILHILFATTGPIDSAYLSRAIASLNIDDLKLILQSMRRDQIQAQQNVLATIAQKGSSNKESNLLLNVVLQSNLQFNKADAAAALEVVFQKRQMNEPSGRDFQFSLLAFMKDLNVQIPTEKAREYLFTEYLNILNSGVEDDGILAKILSLSEEKISTFKVRSEKLKATIVINPLYLLKKKIYEFPDSTLSIIGERFARTTSALFPSGDFMLQVKGDDGSVKQLSWNAALLYSKQNEASADPILVQNVNLPQMLTQAAQAKLHSQITNDWLADLIEILSQDEDLLQASDFPILIQKLMIRTDLRLFLAMSDQSLIPAYQAYLQKPSAETDFLCQKNILGQAQVNKSMIEKLVQKIEAGWVLSDIEQKNLQQDCTNEDRLKSTNTSNSSSQLIHEPPQFSFQLKNPEPEYNDCHFDIRNSVGSGVQYNCTGTWFGLKIEKPMILQANVNSPDSNWIRTIYHLKSRYKPLNQNQSTFLKWLQSTMF